MLVLVLVLGTGLEGQVLGLGETLFTTSVSEREGQQESKSRF